MEIFSHNRLSYFEQCPLKYKFRYIDDLPSQVGQNIEAFLGIRVHETLEKIYRNELENKSNNFEEIKEFFIKSWDSNWSDDIQIVNKRYLPEDYKKFGMNYILNYFLKYLPFNQDKTIGLEKELIFQLDGEDIRIKGIIDRLAKNHDRYIIHDYKTSKHLQSKNDLILDRQLGIYALAVQENFDDIQSIELVWHFLAHDNEIRLKAKKTNLKLIKNEVIDKIKEIQTAKNFTPNKNYLCNWCEYKPICLE